MGKRVRPEHRIRRRRRKSVKSETNLLYLQPLAVHGPCGVAQTLLSFLKAHGVTFRKYTMPSGTPVVELHNARIGEPPEGRGVILPKDEFDSLGSINTLQVTQDGKLVASYRAPDCTPLYDYGTITVSYNKPAMLT